MGGMTDLLSPAEPKAASPGGRQVSLVIAGVTAAVWAVAVGLIAITAVALIAWSTDGRSTSPAAAVLRMAAEVWLLANGTPLRVGGSPFALVPLGLTALPAYLLARAGASLARTVGVADVRGVGRATVALAGSYAVIAVVVTGPAGAAHAGATPLWAFLAAGVIATVCGGLGVLQGAGLWPSVWRALPEWARLAVHGGVLAVLIVLAGAALLAGGALAIHGAEAGTVLRASGPGVVGALVLLVISLAYLPNAVVWSAALVTGPGFAVGTGTAVSAFGVRLGPVPALPLLAALPGTAPRWLPAVLLLPAAGGLLAGALVGRRQHGAPLRRVLGTGLATGCAAGLVMGLLCLAAGGQAGAGRLATVGPSAWRVSLMFAAEVALPAMAAAWWTARHGRGRRT